MYICLEIADDCVSGLVGFSPLGPRLDPWTVLEGFREKGFGEALWFAGT